MTMIRSWFARRSPTSRPWPRRLLDGFLALCGWLLVLLSFLMLLMALPPPIGLSR